MKRLQLVPYREADKRFKLKKHYIVEVKLLNSKNSKGSEKSLIFQNKTKNGDLIIPIPDDIVKAYHIEIGDVAIFEIVDKNSFIVRFVKKTMYSFVEKINIKKIK